MHLRDRKIQTLLLSCLILFHIINNASWLFTHTPNFYCRGKAWEEHLNGYALLVNKIQHGTEHHSYNQNKSALSNLFFINTFYPPLYYYAAFFLKTTLGFISPKIIMLTSSMFLALLLIYLYKLSELLYPGSGLFAAFICSFLPEIYEAARAFNHVTAVCAMVVVNLYYLLKTDAFKNRHYCIMLGICFGIAMLIKYTFFVFLAIPLAISTYEAILWGQQEKQYWILKNIALSALTAIIIAGLFYFNPTVIKDLITRAFNMNRFSISHIVGNLNFLNRLAFYIDFLYAQFLKNSAGVLIILSAIVFFIKKNHGKKILGSTILGSLFLISLVPKYPPFQEYTMAIIPLLSIAASIGLLNMQAPRPILRIAKTGILSLLLILLPFFYSLKAEGSPAFCFDDNSIDKLFKSIGNEQTPIGYFADEYHSVDFLSFEKFLVLWSKNKAPVKNFFTSPTDFCKNFNHFHTLIYLSSNKQDWPEFHSLMLSVESFCQKNSIKLVWNESRPAKFDGKNLMLSKKQLKKFQDSKIEFIKTGQVRFFREYSLTGPSVDVFIYKRIQGPN